jgi:putative ATP-binding cassette transporter
LRGQIGPPVGFYLTVRGGEILFVVGGNGSGKTTLAMLLLGLYEPMSGSILFNGVLVSADNRDEYRQQFSVIFSDFHLFDRLPVASGDLDERRASHYIERLNLQDKVSLRQDRFSTTNLSSGQRKRLALVNAYLENRPFYVFDEWAADQDPAFKKFFYTELLPDMKRQGKGVVIVTHDDAYFHHCDRMVWLEDGAIRKQQSGREPLQSLTGEAHAVEES